MTQLHKPFQLDNKCQTLWMYRVKQDWSGKENCSYNCNLTQCPIAILKKKKGPFQFIQVFFSWYFIPLDKKNQTFVICEC